MALIENILRKNTKLTKTNSILLVNLLHDIRIGITKVGGALEGRKKSL